MQFGSVAASTQLPDASRSRLGSNAPGFSSQPQRQVQIDAGER